MKHHSNVERLTETLRNIGLSVAPEDSEHLLFRPQADSGLASTAFDHIPRYLFRVASPKSAGTTNETWVRSESASQSGNSYTDDIFFDLNIEKRTTIARTLNLHLRWWPKDGLRNNFVSWTSSLLFAIQYIYYRHLSREDGSSLEKIKLYVIDTKRFPKGIFLRDLDLIDAFWEFDNHRTRANLENLRYIRNESENYFGEYLPQGSLKIVGKCEIISGQSLFKDDRLRRLQPHFREFHDIPVRNGKPIWVKEVIRLREAVWRATDEGIVSSAEMSDRLEALKEIVQKLNPSWRYSLAIYFASLGSSDSSTEEGNTAMEITLSYFQSTFPDGELTNTSTLRKDMDMTKGAKNLQGQQVWRSSNAEIIAPETMPELKEVKRLAYGIYRYCTLKRALGWGLSYNLPSNSLRFSLTENLDRVSTAEASISSLFFDDIFSENGLACAVDDSNELVDHTSRNLLTRLRSVQSMCERLTLGISSNVV
jgi:hypothetical protein